MIKIEFEKIQEAPHSVTEYDSRYYGPFTTALRPIDSVPLTTYARNIYARIFIEFRFDHYNRTLYEISLVSFDQKDSKKLDPTKLRLRNDEYFKCLINELETVLDHDDPSEFLVGESAVEIRWSHISEADISYFQIAKGCHVGMDDKGWLSSVLWELTTEEISAAFGV